MVLWNEVGRKKVYGRRATRTLAVWFMGRDGFVAKYFISQWAKGLCDGIAELCGGGCELADRILSLREQIFLLLEMPGLREKI